MGSFFQRKNILVAGGGGLVGQSLIRQLLDHGAHVRATQFKTRKINLDHPHLNIVTCDLSSYEEAKAVFQDMDIAFLAAAKVRGAKAQKENASELILDNLSLHARLIHLASEMKLDRCAFISSSYVYPHTGKPNVEEEGFQGDPPGPVNYGLGWVCRYLETLCQHFQMSSSTKYAIVRPTAYYGPHDRFDEEDSHVIPALIVKAVRQMNPFEVWGTGDDLRCFTYVDDLVDGLLLTLEKHAVAGALNICTSEVSSVKDVLPLLFKHLNFFPKVVFNSTKPSMIPYKVSNPERAEKILGWKSKVSLNEGLKKTIDWYLKNQTLTNRTAR